MTLLKTIGRALTMLLVAVVLLGPAEAGPKPPFLVPKFNQAARPAPPIRPQFNKAARPAPPIRRDFGNAARNAPPIWRDFNRAAKPPVVTPPKAPTKPPGSTPVPPVRPIWLPPGI